jgi:hypothetical protein
MAIDQHYWMAAGSVCVRARPSGLQPPWSSPEMRNGDRRRGGVRRTLSTSIQSRGSSPSMKAAANSKRSNALARKTSLPKGRVREYLPYRMLEVEVAANAIYKLGRATDPRPAPHRRAPQRPDPVRRQRPPRSPSTPQARSSVERLQALPSRTKPTRPPPRAPTRTPPAAIASGRWNLDRPDRRGRLGNRLAVFTQALDMGGDRLPDQSSTSWRLSPAATQPGRSGTPRTQLVGPRS